MLAAAEHYGATSRFFVFWVGATGHGGPMISAPTLERIASFGAYLDFDIYDSSDDEADHEPFLGFRNPRPSEPDVVR